MDRQTIENILGGVGEEYEKLHPEISDYDTYSISTLSHDIQKQIFWKKNPSYKNLETNLVMTKGRAWNEFIQRRLRNTWITEYPVQYVGEKFKLTGHLDAVDFKNSDVLEIKTTRRKFYPRNEYLLQCGAYCKLMELEQHRQFNGTVLVITEFFGRFWIELEREQIEQSFEEILKRANQVWSELHKNAN